MQPPDQRNLSAQEYVCPKCDGDGYTETWNEDQSDVHISVCSCQMLAQGIEEAWLDE